MTIVTDSKLVAMQRLQQASPHYTHHTTGEMTVEKFEKLRAKFARLYGVDDSASSKSRAKKKGFAVATLIAWLHRHGRVYFWLLASEGRGSVWTNEQLAKNSELRIKAFGGYELVHDGRSWSWRYVESHIRSLQMSIHNFVAHKKDDQLAQLIEQIFRTAGFRLARQQAGHLIAFFRADWKRLRREPLPTVPTRMLYVRTLPNDAPTPKKRKQQHATRNENQTQENFI